MQKTVSEPPVTLRVGLLGERLDAGRALADGALARLAAGLRVGGTAPVLRLLCTSRDYTPEDGWQVHYVLASGPASPCAAARADTLVLDSDPADPDGGFAAAAAATVRHSDVLLLLGDVRSEPLAGSVRMATGLGLPVLWLPSDGPTRLVLRRGWHLSTAPLLEGEAAWEAALARLRAVLAAPRGADAPSMDQVLPRRRLWLAHQSFMRALWRMPVPAEQVAMPPPPWTALYEAADRLASGYADRYRSSYTLVLGLAAVALIAAVLGLGLPLDEHGHPRVSPFWTALPEAACLAGIIALVWTNARSRWQSRLIAFRLLAELCRKQAALSLVARSLPAARIAQMTHEGDLGWVGRHFAAVVRAAPFPAGTLAGPQLALARDGAAAILLRGQRAYHEARAEANRRREKRLVQLGGWAFALTVACVAIKLALLTGGVEGAEAFGLVAALLPAAAAALFGLRAYAELELLVRGSEAVITALDTAADNLEHVDTDRPGASQHIGDVLEEAALAMLSDIDGWIQLSRVKAVEAG